MNVIQSVSGLFESQVALFPDRCALSVDDKRLTYVELNEKANQLAHYLIQIKDDEIPFLPLFLDKSEVSLISILAILKTGMAYIPISPEATSPMIDSIFINSKAKYVITDSIKAPQFKYKNIELIQIDQIQDELEGLPKINLLNKPLSSDFAYVIYTSGTTGQPKGVLVTHDNLLNTYYSWERSYQLTENDIHLQMANIAFDVFAGDYLRALGSGAELVLCSKDTLVQTERLVTLILKRKITCAEFIPAVLRNVLSYLKSNSLSITQMRLLICGSDLWTMAEFREAKKLFGESTRLINSYGLTEATIDSTFFEEDNDTFDDNELVPIGRPFSHVTLYLLDEYFNPLTHDVGEIYIGGLGVAKGYLGQEELTKERFVFHPVTQERLYKTGDLGRLRADGTIELLGRNQSHIKINGNRVELLTLESILNQHPKIKFGIVSSKTKGYKIELVCFILVSEPSFTFEELNSHILNHLPKYYLPRDIYLIEELVLTQNGKVDRSIAAQKITKALKPNNVPPQNEMEHQILDIWKRQLGVQEIGVTHHFYELGGTSLLFVEMINALNKTFQLNLNYCNAAPTVYGLAQQISSLILNEKSMYCTE